MFVRQASVSLLLLALVFVGVNVAPSPATLPPAHGQSLGVVGTILGLVTIAGIVYLITRDQNGVYHRYPYGHYDNGHYMYNGSYHTQQYRTYEGRWYRGEMPHNWQGDSGCIRGRWQSGRCR